MLFSVPLNSWMSSGQSPSGKTAPLIAAILQNLAYCAENISLDKGKMTATLEAFSNEMEGLYCSGSGPRVCDSNSHGRAALRIVCALCGT